MSVYPTVGAAFAAVPDFVSFLILPAIFLAYVLCSAFFGARRLYYPLAFALGGLGAALLSVHGASPTVAFCGLWALAAIMLRPLYFIRVRKKDRGTERKLCESGELPKGPRARPKTDAEVTAGECLKLRYAEELLDRLKKSPLAASDRIEAESISRALPAFRKETLCEEEAGRLSDCLSSVLKLVAKYRL